MMRDSGNTGRQFPQGDAAEERGFITKWLSAPPPSRVDLIVKVHVRDQEAALGLSYAKALPFLSGARRPAAKALHIRRDRSGIAPSNVRSMVTIGCYPFLWSRPFHCRPRAWRQDRRKLGLVD